MFQMSRILKKLYNDVPLAVSLSRDQASDCDVTISDSILVSILLYS